MERGQKQRTEGRGEREGEEKCTYGGSVRICLALSRSDLLFSASSNSTCIRAYSASALPYAIFFSRSAARSTAN